MKSGIELAFVYNRSYHKFDISKYDDSYELENEILRTLNLDSTQYNEFENAYTDFYHNDECYASFPLDKCWDNNIQNVFEAEKIVNQIENDKPGHGIPIFCGWLDCKPSHFSNFPTVEEIYENYVGYYPDYKQYGKDFVLNNVNETFLTNLPVFEHHISYFEIGFALLDEYEWNGDYYFDFKE